MSIRMLLWVFLFLFGVGGLVLSAGVKAIKSAVNEAEFSYNSGTARLRVVKQRNAYLRAKSR